MPVVRTRGALPLPINSLLFTDPAYDADLGSAPVSHREPIAHPHGAALPTGRGDLMCSLYADRGRINRAGSIVFMVDLAFERPMPPLAQSAADNVPSTDCTDGGDLTNPGSCSPFELTLAVTRREGNRRDLFYAALPTDNGSLGKPLIGFSKVYELPLGAIIEADGTAAQLNAGDMLELTAAERMDQRVQPSFWDPDSGHAISLDKLDDSGGTDSSKDLPFTRTLRLLITDEPVVERPPALYTALVRRKNGVPQDGTALKPARLSLPLFAQSPLPWRVVLRNAKADFRAGFMRRSAVFVWSLARPVGEIEATGMYIEKMDRNGQTHLPQSVDEFIPSRAIVTPVSAVRRSGASRRSACFRNPLASMAVDG